MSTEINTVAELLPVIYTLIATQVLIPVGTWVKSKLTKDPMKDVIKRLDVTLLSIDKELKINNKSGSLDGSTVLKVYHTSLKLAMLRLLSLYIERCRLNHILEERHRVMRRYERAGLVIAQKLYAEMDTFTAIDNKRKLSGFLRNEGAALFIKKVTDELFIIQEQTAKGNTEFAFSIEDIESSLESFIASIINLVKGWLIDDAESLESVWNDIEQEISLIGGLEIKNEKGTG